LRNEVKMMQKECKEDVAAAIISAVIINKSSV
jgi:hypothetical protein